MPYRLCAVRCWTRWCLIFTVDGEIDADLAACCNIVRAANAEDNVAGCGSYGLGSIRGDLGSGSFVTGLGSIRGRLGSGAVGDNRGGRIRNNGSFAAGDDFNIGCIVLAEEIYGEVVGVTCFEFVIIRTAADVALSGSDPDTVTGSRVRNAPVIGACGYFDGDGVVDNDVARCGAAVCIYGNLILECIVQTCGCIAALGSVMNPNDHPHGGGEGKTSIGRPGPCTPWGKPALGLKTRKKNKQSNKLIVRRRDGKAIKEEV